MRLYLTHAFNVWSSIQSVSQFIENNIKIVGCTTEFYNNLSMEGYYENISQRW